MDAVTKCGHYGKCASGTKDIPTNINCFFAGPEATIREFERDGQLNLKSFVDSDITSGKS